VETRLKSKEERFLIMKTRKLFATIAAAATMLGGMAFGAVGAQADGSASITIQHSQKGHTYSAYKFATLTVAGDAVQVDTDEEWITAVNKAVETANATMTPPATTPTEYNDNPAAYAATKTGEGDEAWFRAFAAAMSAGQAASDGSTEGDGDTATIGSLAEGWYLVTDTDKDGNFGANAIVATTINGISGTFKVKGDTATGQGRIEAVGAFVAKNENKPEEKPQKTADETTTADGVAIGQTVTYTITVDIPETAAGYKEYPYFVRDIASKGLTVNKDFAAKIGGAAESFEYATEPTVGADGRTTTVLKFDLGGKSGQLVITYTAVVNKDIIDTGAAGNTADVSRDGTNWGPEIEAKVYTGGFSLHKYGVGADATGLAGATFNVYEGESASGEPMLFVKTADGEYRLAEADEEGASADVVTTTGNVRIAGLKSGAYTLKETGFVDGYAENFVPTFTVHLVVAQKDDDNRLAGESTFTLSGNNLALASVSDNNVIQVKNVKSITQLPLTGAAGTALFTIVALLMAGAGLALAFRFRGSNAAMGD